MGVNDINMSVAVKRHALGHGQIAGSVSFLADRLHAAAIQVEQLHPEIPAVSNKKPVPGGAYVCGKVELARSGPSLADRLDQRSGQVEHGQVVSVAIHDVELPAFRHVGDAHRTLQHVATESPLKTTLAVQFDHLVALGIGYKESFTGPCCPHRRRQPLIAKAADHMV